MQNHRITRREFARISATGSTFLLAGVPVSGEENMEQTIVSNEVVEIEFQSTQDYKDPYRDVECNIEMIGPGDKTIVHPAFWAGGRTWKARVSASKPGEYRYVTACSNANDTGLSGQRGTMTVCEYRGRNPLFYHGRVRVAEDKRHFEHEDGTPFFWLGDTWWMGLCSRLDYPDGFRTLAEDRKRKGFNVIQIVAGPYPDMEENDPRGQNPAGFPFTSGFESVNPGYFDDADRKIIGLVEMGFMPCIVGMWGYYLPRIGVDGCKRFWRYLVARYGAYPVAWCIAGEGTMPFYLSETKEKDAQEQLKGWTEVTRFVRELDGFHNMITIHPTRFGREMVEDPSLLDFDMLQTGHSDLDTVPYTAKSVIQSYGSEPVMPVVVGEVNYEGIMGRCWQNIERMSFYASVLNGSAGHTYGANGIWQMSTPDQPYGNSPHGRSWGNTPWQEAYRLPGSAQMGIGKKFMKIFPWWKLERRPEWVEPEYDPSKPYSCIASGIPGKLRILYSPLMWDPPKIRGIEAEQSYRAYFFDPIRGEGIPIGKVKPEADGSWRAPRHPGEVHDWLVVLEAEV